VLARPDLEHATSGVLSSLTSRSGQRTYDHAIREFVGWRCSDPRLAFNRRSSCAIGPISNSGSTRRPQSTCAWPVLLGHVSVQITERYLGCKQKLRCAVNDWIGIEPDAGE
jgi:hypothetical protein